MSRLFNAAWSNFIHELKRIKCDSPLTDLGKSQAEEAKKYFESEHFPFQVFIHQQSVRLIH